jgi:hypothetical protein
LNKKQIKFTISYITNFKPADFLTFKDFKIFKTKNKQKIISRNFFLFLILLKYTNTNDNINISLFVKPTFKKSITLLRAPYRYKLARHQFILSRYFIVFSFYFKIKELFIHNNNSIINFIKLVKTFYV